MQRALLLLALPHHRPMETHLYPLIAIQVKGLHFNQVLLLQGPITHYTSPPMTLHYQRQPRVQGGHGMAWPPARSHSLLPTWHDTKDLTLGVVLKWPICTPTRMRPTDMASRISE